MSKATPAFKEKVVALIGTLSEKYQFGRVKTGDDNVIAAATILGLDGGIKDRLLVLTQRNGEQLAIQARNLLFFGSRGALANRAVDHLIESLFLPSDSDDDGLSSDNTMLLGLLVDAFCSSTRSIDDIVALVAVGSNDTMVRTRAAVDFSDGETYVDACIRCNFEDMPEGLTDTVGAVLQHAALLIRIDGIIRDHLAEDTTLSPRTLKNLSKKLARKHEKSPDGEAQEDSGGEHEAPLML